jgi:hypothetical protein
VNTAFSKEEFHMAKKHMKKCSTSLATKGMEIKTILTFYPTPVRMATMKNINSNKCWGVRGGKKDPSYISGENEN